MVLAEPGLIIATAVEPLDQLEIASQRERWVDAGFVKGRKKDTEAQAVHQRSSAVCYVVFLVGIILRFFDRNKAAFARRRFAHSSTVPHCGSMYQPTSDREIDDFMTVPCSRPG